jgi:hypothetical protein
VKPTSAQLRQMQRDNLAWPPTLAPVPRADWPMPRLEHVEGRLRTAAWRSRKFLVQEFAEDHGIVRLSVNRTEWDERQRRFREDISWDDLQSLKAEAGYADRCAVEVFPPDDLVVNVANMRHLFVFPAGAVPPFVWGAERALSDA